MSDGWYDTAQICTNGHVINTGSISYPENNSKFCDRCGAPTITNCPNCSAFIRGCYRGGVISFGYTPPSFCPHCGNPYPWTEARLKAAKELADELDNLSLEEQEMLKKSIDDIIRDTPQTPVAAKRFKRLVTKAGQVAAEGFKKILFDVASEAAKRIIWP